jgi:sodium-dependent dicarboxylate transporter 2/3/5
VPIMKMIRSGASFDVLGALLIVLLLPIMVELVLGAVGG